MTKENIDKPAQQSFWAQVFSANPQTIVTPDNFDKAMPRPEKLGEGGDFWLTRLFQGEGFYGNPSDKMIILKNGVEVHEVPIEQLNQDTVIGRHPEAHIQLEAYKLGLFHIVLRKKDDRLYVEAIDEDYGTLLNRKKIKVAQPVLLRDGSLVDIPGYRLRFCLAGAPLTEEEEALDAEELTIKGPAGKFSCFNYPAAKMLFIGAGSGITPLMAMSRWIVDTTSDVDVKLLASFKSPSDIIFRKELELISARHSRFQVAVTLTSGWRGTEFLDRFRRTDQQIDCPHAGAGP